MRERCRPGRIIILVALMCAVCAAAPARGAAATAPRWCPAQTGYCAEGAFLSFWEAVDAASGGYGLDILGFPISPVRRDPQGMIVQFYERAIFEWHPENPPPYRVELARLGALQIGDQTKLALTLRQQAAAPPTPCGSTVSCYTFSQTNHTVRGTFLEYWAGNGGLSVFGLPLTDQFSLLYYGSQGYQTYLVQYFERNRFEAHPEQTNLRYRVLLGRLGAEYLAFHAAQIGAWPVVPAPVDSGS